MSKSVAFYGFLESVLPRTTLWRLGRFLYLGARRELKNNPETNGEYALLRSFLARLGGQTGPATVCDIGANFGHWSIEAIAAAESSGLTLDLHLFEPAPDQRKRLEGNLASIDTTRHSYTVHEAALADQDGELPFAITGSDSGNSALLAGDAQGDASVITVPVTTLDALMKAKGIERVAFAKVDTEGNDFNVVLGAQDAFSRKAIAVMQIEYNWRWLDFGHFLKKVFTLVQPLGYRIGKVTGHGVEFYDQWHPELDRMIETNFVIVDEQCADLVEGTRYKFAKANVPQAIKGTQ